MRKARKSRNAVMMITIAPYIGGKPEKENNIILWIIVLCYAQIYLVW